MRNSFIDELVSIAHKDPNVYLITGDLGFGVLEDFEKQFPQRFINSGVSEQAMMGMAAGLAEENNLVFVYSIGNFPTLRCIEQIRNDVLYMNRPVVIVSVGAGFSYGAQGYTHHTLEDVACLNSLAGLNIYSPSDSYEARECLKDIVTKRVPAYIRLGKDFGSNFHNEPGHTYSSRMPQIKSGVDGAIVATGSVVNVAIEAGEILRDSGVEISIYSCPSICPLPITHISELAGYKPLIVIEEHVRRGGLYSSILEQLGDLGQARGVRSVSVSTENLKLLGDQEFLRKSHGISAENIIKQFESATAELVKD